MRAILKIIVFVAILAAAYQFREPLRERLLPLLDGVRSYFTAAPCAEPIPYRLGGFDTKFGVSQKYFIEALSEAEAVWEEPWGGELFAYAPEDSASDVLRINLVYDYRQQATKTLAGLGIVVENNRASYDSLKDKFTGWKAQFAAAKEDYEARVRSFNQKQAVYEESVEHWNARGGAPKKEYDALQKERSALEQEAAGLKARERELGRMVEEINSMVVVLNRLADNLNLSVERYNTVGASRGESFEEGVYFTEGNKREIDIYEFENREKLVRVLAHEFGHALGLGHVEDPEAIMYKLNQGDTEQLTEADLAALGAVCQ